MTKSKTITLALTGASGMPYAIRLLEVLLAGGHNVFLLYSQASQIVAKQEMDLVLSSRPKEVEQALQTRFNNPKGALKVLGREEWYSPVASGSNSADAMVVCPCSMGTLAAIATGLSDNLIERAADVMLKENRKLIVVPRETPLSAIHLQNMLTLSHAGCVILPANPGFYHRPGNLSELVDFIVARILDHLEVPHDLVARWGQQAEGA